MKMNKMKCKRMMMQSVKNLYAQYEPDAPARIQKDVGGCFGDLMSTHEECVVSSQNVFKSDTDGINVPTEKEIKQKMKEIVKEKKMQKRAERRAKRDEW